MGAFDHHETNKHDDDIRKGAVHIVSSILRSLTPFFVAKADQVKSCCILLLQLYRCSVERARASFCTDGCALITNLLEVVEIHYRLGKLGDTECLLLSKEVIEKLLDVAKVPLSMVKNEDDFISSLVSNVMGASGKYVMQLSLKSITSLSDHIENKQVLLTPGLLKAVEVGSRHLDPLVREEAAKIVMNLAWEAKNKSKLLHSSMETLLGLLAEDGGSTAMQSYVLQALGHLAVVADNKVQLVNHKNGMFISTLVHVASSAGQYQANDISINSTKIIGYLICRATASKIGSIPGLFATISSLACRSDGLASVAAKAIHKLAAFIHYHPFLRELDHASLHTSLLQAMVTISYSKSTDVLRYAVKSYAEQVPFRRDRIQMIAHRGLLSALSVLTHNGDSNVKECAKEVLIALACDVAEARKTSVEKLLRCVAPKSKVEVEQRSYSPTSVTDAFSFEADFESL